MSKKEKKEVSMMSQMLIYIDRNIHMEAKAQAAYRNQSMKEYVTDALLAQIEKDKSYQRGV